MREVQKHPESDSVQVQVDDMKRLLERYGFSTSGQRGKLSSQGFEVSERIIGNWNASAPMPIGSSYNPGDYAQLRQGNIELSGEVTWPVDTYVTPVDWYGRIGIERMGGTDTRMFFKTYSDTVYPVSKMFWSVEDPTGLYIANLQLSGGSFGVPSSFSIAADTMSIWASLTIGHGPGTGHLWVQGGADFGETGLVTAAGISVFSDTSSQLNLMFSAAKYTTFTVDTNHDLTIKPTSTGQIIFRPTTAAVDFWQISNIAGNPVVRWDAINEELGIGVAPAVQLTVGHTITHPPAYPADLKLLLTDDTNAGDAVAMLLQSRSDAISSIYFGDETDGDRSYIKVKMSAGAIDYMAFAVAAAERMRINVIGQVLIGNTVPLNAYDMLTMSLTNNYNVTALDVYSDTLAHEPMIHFRRSHSDVLNTLAETLDTEALGSIRWYGASSTPLRSLGAQIQAIQVGNAGAVFIPVDLVFSVATSTTTNEEAMRIYSNKNVTTEGNVSIGTGLTETVFYIDGAAGQVRDLRYLSGGSLRWIIRANSTAEGGANAGSDLQVICRTDAGAALFTPIHITRSTGNIGLGTTAPNASALLDMTSTTKSFLPPRMTTAQRDLIAGPIEGMLVFNLTTHVLNYYTGAAWAAV